MDNLNVIVQVTSDCNLRCKYCSASAGESGKKDSMAPDTVKNLIEKVVKRTPKSVTKFTWHGGEPLLAGLDFYRQVVAVQKNLEKKGYVIDNSLQTNGTLITETWAKFFREHDFRPGFSLDGPREINDSNRIFLDGRGTYDYIKKGTQILKNHGFDPGYLGVVSCLQNSSQEKLTEIIRAGNNKFTLNMVTPVGRADGDNLKELINDFGDFMIDLFERWFNGEGKNFLSPVASKYVVPILTGNPSECTLLKSCQQYFIAIAQNGDVYPCIHFTNFPEFCYGNILTDTFDDLLNHPQRVNLINRAKNLGEECRTECEHFSICYGGCPLDAYVAEGDINAKDYECVSHKKIFSHIKFRIEKEIEVEN